MYMGEGVEANGNFTPGECHMSLSLYTVISSHGRSPQVPYGYEVTHRDVSVSFLPGIPFTY